MSIVHPFVSGIADNPAAQAAGEVLPSHWNADHVIDGIQMATPETANWYITPSPSDEGDYIDNTLQIGFNCENGSRVDLTEIAWYLQWESKFDNGGDFISEFHLNYIGTEGTQRRLFSFDVDRATHATRGNLILDRFSIQNPADDQWLNMDEDGHFGINQASPVATLDIKQLDEDVPALTLRTIASVDVGASVFEVIGCTGVTVASFTGGDEYEAALNLIAPGTQSNGPRVNFTAGANVGAVGMNTNGTVFIHSFYNPVELFYESGVFFYNNASGDHLDMQLWQGEIRMNSTPVFTGDTANGQSLKIKALTEELTIANTATSTTTIQKPANSIVLAVSVRVTTAVTCTTNFTVGDSGSAARFSTIAVPKGAGNTNPGTKAGAYYNATAEGIIITPDTTPTDSTGRVRVTIHYIEANAPSS